MEHKTLEKSFFFSLLILTGIFALFVLKPFLTVLVVGASLAITFSPVFHFLRKRIYKERWFGALLTTLCFIILLTGPLFFLGTVIVKESESVYKTLTIGEGIDPVITNLEANINSYLSFLPHIDLREIGTNIASSLSSHIGSIFTATVNTIIAVILVILTMFYFLKDGNTWKNALIKFSPLSTSADEKIMDRLIQAVNGVIRGYLLIALVQGILMGIGLWIFDVPNPALWGTLAGIMSLIPSVGTASVSFPAVLYLLIIGSVGNAIGLLIWALVFVGLVDNVLNPILVGNRVNLPPLFILLAVLGGIALFGPVGILIGPLVIALLFTLVDIYKTEYR